MLKYTALGLLISLAAAAQAQEVEAPDKPGSITPTMQNHDLEKFEAVPHALLIQDPLLGSTATLPGMTGTACFNAAFDLANYAEKETACLNEETGFLSISYGF